MITRNKSHANRRLKASLPMIVGLVLFINFSCNLTDPLPTNVVIAPSNQNFIYAHIDNPLEIAASGFPSEDIRVTIDIGTIRREKGKYVVNVEEPGTAQITVWQKSSSGTDVILRKMDFRVIRVPDPTTTVGGKYVSGRIPVKKLIEAGSIVAQIPDFHIGIEYPIVSYDLTLSRKDGDLTKLSSDQSKFTQTMLDNLGTAKSGDLVFIDRVKVIGPDGQERKLAGIAFEIN
ncbi:MAG: hypothetical protein IH948_05970 [Bacteroidetes bacterium]|nr:hypothetical protein [Bacteroidota bacterium]